MRIAHVILAHTYPMQLQRLVQRLMHPNADCFIHIDAKSNAAAFSSLLQMPNIYLVQKRVNITWFSFSIAQAILNSFEQIVAAGNQYDYVNVLSGQDYPLQDAFFMHQYFALHRGRQFMECYSIYNSWKEALPSITRYHLTNYEMRGKHKLEKVVNKLMPERRMPCDLEPVGRSPWFTTTLPAIKYVLHYLHDYPEVIRFFKLTRAPHEFIFQTVLFNSNFKGSVENNNLRYTDRSSGRPKTLTLHDLTAMQQSGCLFARKLNMQTDRGLMDAIDALSRSSICV